MRLSPKLFALAVATLMLVVSMGVAQAYDPPLRVARLSYVDGDVSFSPAGERQWLRARRNRPHVRGDRFWTSDRSRAELQMGAAVVRMDERTSLEILNLDDRYAQFELTQGTLNLRVLRLYEGQTYEVATPTLAFVVSEPGEYRIDVDERGGWTEVVMWEGRAIAYGERSRFPLRAGDAIRFVEPTLRDYDVFRFPRPDSFDRFAELRNERLERALSLRYVPDDLIGYSDLDEYGSWSSVREYGNVWFPTRVNAGWAPYRHGNWIWQDPWGWTWVDDADWGFAPFHYGRWVQVDRRWGWIPSARRSRAVYAPALVAFLGTGSAYSGGRQPIGWFPLGPRDVYVPSYSASRDYFTRINSGYSTINVSVINNVYNSYSSGGRLPQREYMYRSNRDAVTAVPADVFVNARPVRAAALPYDRSNSAFSEATHIARMAPTVQSFTGNAPASAAAPSREVLDRRVIARTAPPPAAVPFESRRQALGRTPGRPLDPAEMDTMRGQGRGRGADAAQQVRVVGAGTPVQRPENEARDATRQLERMGGGDPEAGGREGGFDRGRDAGEGRSQRGRAAEAADAEREALPERGEPRMRGRESAPADEAQRQQAEREAGRQAEQATREEQRRLEQEERQEAQRQQGEAERTQREARQEREQAMRAAEEEREQARRIAEEERRAAQEAQRAEREQQRQQREAEQAQQQERQQAEAAQREQERQQREAQAAQREQERQQREAEAAAREQERQQREAEQAERQARQAQEQQQAEAQREQERQQREAERAQRQAEQEQQQAERAARQQQQEAQQAEAAQRELERQQRQAEQAERQAQQEQQQAERAQREQQQAAQQAEAAQRQAEREQREAERAQEPAAEGEEDEEEGRGRGRSKRDRDGG